MVAAMVYPEAKRGRGNIDPAINAAKIAGFRDRAIQEARAVLRLASELAPLVMTGNLPLADAYKEANDRENAAASAEARMAKLRALAPDFS